MAEPFLSEIRLFSFGYAPHGWAFCDGQLLPISQNQALFSLMGTFYGGNGVQNFALPNLQGRVAIHQGNNYVIGQAGGEAGHILNANEIPVHSHTLAVGGAATTTDPTGGLFATPGVNTRLGEMYSSTGGASASPAAVAATGQSQPHNNMQPYTVLNYAIAMSGIFPSRN